MFEKLKKWYSGLSAPVKAAAWFVVCGFLQKGISLLTTPVFTRLMTDAEYGRYSTYATWMEIVQIIVSLNLAAGVYSRGLVKNEEDADRFSSSVLGLSTTCILIGVGIYAIFRNWINSWLELSTVLMIAMLVDIWAQAAYQFWASRERFHYRYRKLILLTLCYTALRPLLGILCVLNVDTGHQVEARVLATAVVDLALFVGLYIAISRKGKQFYNKQYWSYALKFNLPLIPHYLSQVVLNKSDKLMIKRICGSEQTAYYSVAYNLAAAMQILSNAISGTMNPWIYQNLKRNRTAQIAKVSYMVLVFIALVNLAVVLVAPELLAIMAPESYQSAVWVVPPVTVSVFFMYMYNLFATVEYYHGKTLYATVATVVGAAMNVAINAIFIPIYGFVAAGYTTLACYIIYAIAHYICMRRVCRKYMDNAQIYSWKVIALIAAGLMVCSAVIMMLYDLPLVRYGLLLVVAAIVVWQRKRVISLLRMLRERE